MTAIPRVSVLMPVYNGEQFLREAIESILDQTFTEYEFIIINDGSTDGTAAILESYSDPRILRFHNPYNLGVVATRNRAFSIAKAPYIANMDADDISPPERLATQVSFLDAHPDYGVVGLWNQRIDERGRHIRLHRRPTTDYEICRNLINVDHLVNGSIIARRALVEMVGGYRDFYGCEDYDLWLRLAEITLFAILPNPIYSLRKHSNSMTVVRAEEHFQATRKAVEFAKQRLMDKPDSMGYQRPRNIKLNTAHYAWARWKSCCAGGRGNLLKRWFFTIQAFLLAPSYKERIDIMRVEASIVLNRLLNKLTGSC